MSYNEELKIPNWVAYHVTDEYVKAPGRVWEFEKFHKDPTITEPVLNSHYSGEGYDKGHLAPYYICGGDRNNNGHFAQKDINGDGNYNKNELDINNDGKLSSADKAENEYFYIDDFFDLKTVQEVNYLSNVAPQHENFNRNSGIWYDTEVLERDILKSDEIDEIWVFAGCIKLGDSYIHNDIFVPEAFSKIIILKREPEISDFLAFLLPHYREKDLDKEIENYLVSIDLIEEWSGLDFKFFPNLNDSNDLIESYHSKDNWVNIINILKS